MARGGIRAMILSMRTLMVLALVLVVGCSCEEVEPDAGQRSCEWRQQVPPACYSEPCEVGERVCSSERRDGQVWFYCECLEVD